MTAFRSWSRGSMLAAAVALFFLAGSGCADRVLIDVEVPDAYDAQVSSLVLHVLEPPLSEPFDCRDLSFDLVGDTIVELSERSRVTLTAPGQGEDVTLDRDAGKLLWVEALDDASLPVLHGCAALGNIDDNTTVAVDLQPAVIFDAILTSVTEEEQTFLVRLRDVLGDPIANRDVLVRVVEPGRPVDEGLVSSDAAGEAVATAAAAVNAGPRLVEIAPVWTRAGAEQFRGFSVPRPTFVPIPGPVLESARGRVGPQGEPGIVAIVEVDPCRDTGNLGWAAAVLYRDQATAQTEALFDPSTCLEMPRPAMAIAPLDATRDRGVMIAYDDARGAHVWMDVWLETNAGSGGVELASQSGALLPDPGVDPLAVLRTGPCDGSDVRLMLLDAGRHSLGVWAAPSSAGAPSQDVTDPFDRDGPAYVESLCVSDGAGGVHRSLFGIDNGPTAYLERDGDPCQYHWGNNNPASAPTAAAWAGEPLMVYTALERGLYEFEAVAARWDLAACQPFPVIRDSIPGTPVSTLGGDVDGDGHLDLISLVSGGGFDDTGAPVTRRFVWASLSTAYRDERLAGVSRPIALLGDQAATYDANGDGFDDIVFSSDKLIVIYPMGPLQ